MLLGSEQRVGEALLFALVRVGDRNPLPLVAVVLDDIFLPIPHDDDELLGVIVGYMASRLSITTVTLSMRGDSRDGNCEECLN